MIPSKSIKLSAIAVAMASLLSACGGGSSSKETPFQAKAFDGVAIDFYLSGATVKFDDCNTSTTTDDNGKFNYTTTEACQESSITVTGGKDIVTGLDFDGVLKAKKINLQNLNVSSTASEVVISPLSTLEYYADAGSANLDSLLDKLSLSSLKGKNFTSFDPQLSATAEEMARIFLLQQIANKLDETSSSEAGFAQLIKALEASTTGLFVDGELNVTLLTAILDVETANNFDALYALLIEEIKAAGDNVDLAELIKDNEDLVEAIVKYTQSSAYKDILIAGKTLTELKASTATSPINLSLASLKTILNVNFKPSSNLVTSDSIQIAFKLKGTQGAQSEYLDVLVEKVDLTFKDGVLTKAVIPAGVKVSVRSSLYSVEAMAFSLNNDTDLGSSINLDALVNNNATLKNYYDRFYNLLNVGALIEAEAFIKSNSYNKTSAELEAEKLVTVGSSSFTGENLKAFFKLN